MNFKLMKINRENSKTLCSFVSSIYRTLNDKPLTIKVIGGDTIDSSIMVLDDKVISTLVEDRGISATEAWNLYTFMDMMDKAGYEIEPCDERSNVRFFHVKYSHTCASCMDECLHTGKLHAIPVYTSEGPTFMEVVLCPKCSAKFDEEYKKFVNFEYSEEQPKKEGKLKKFFKRMFKKDE